ncbi:hypothetical protein [Streptomyces sp. NPDC058486]|uniref:hypothetical protein n=1 Tax=unclassified Streptomyces TaxID=2593676 RepID=UPI0036617677
MTATTFTLVTTVPRPRRLMAALRAFGSAAVEVALLGDYGDYGDASGPGGAGIKNPRPAYAHTLPPD